MTLFRLFQLYCCLCCKNNPFTHNGKEGSANIAKNTEVWSKSEDFTQ